jgi:hypothetical protein
MLSPIAASDRIRNGIITEARKNGPPNSGMTMKATARMMARPMRSCRIGKIA